MAPKKKRRNRKGDPPKRVLSVLGVFLGTVLLVTLYVCLNFSGGSGHHTTYEEVYSSQSRFLRDVKAIDKIIYEALYQGGVPEENILFVDVRPMHRARHVWDYTELKILLREEQDPGPILRKIARGISRSAPSAATDVKIHSKKESLYRVTVLGLPTHTITISCTGRGKAAAPDRPKLAIIIDDLGYDAEIAKECIALDLPLTFSVLPIAPHTARVVKDVKAAGRALMLHLPMEPKGYPRLNPGPGAIYTGMEAREIRHIIDLHLARVPGAMGINNHMGSLFTERRRGMRIVMEEAKRRGLYFIDSRTTTGTVAEDVAHELGVRVARRNVFLDDDPSPPAIGFQMERLMGFARKEGAAIGIGHPSRTTLKVLRQYSHKLKKDYRIVPVSTLTH